MSAWVEADSDVGSMTSIAACLKDLEHVTESEFRTNSPAAALQKTVDRRTDVSLSSSPLSGDTFPDIARLSTLSAQLVEEERWEEALKVVVDEHDLASRAYGDAHERTLQALATYAGVLWQLDRGQDARELLEELVQKRTQLAEAIDSNAPERAVADESLADALVELSTVSQPAMLHALERHTPFSLVCPTHCPKASSSLLRPPVVLSVYGSCHCELALPARQPLCVLTSLRCLGLCSPRYLLNLTNQQQQCLCCSTHWQSGIGCVDHRAKNPSSPMTSLRERWRKMAKVRMP